MKGLALAAALALCALFSGCGAAAEPPRPGPRLVVYSTLSSPLVGALVNEFEKQSGVRVDLVPGDAMTYPEDAGEADVFMGLPAELAQEQQGALRLYSTANAPYIRPALRMTEDCVTCFATGRLVLLVNTNLWPGAAPDGYAGLLAEALKDRVAVPDPAYSAAGFLHIVNLLDAFGEEEGWRIVRRLLANRLVRPVTTAAGAAALAAEGRVTAAMTTENAAFEALAGGAPVRVVYMREGAPGFAAGVSVSAWTSLRREAERFVDFLTSRGTQLVLAQQMYYRPVRGDVEPDALLAAGGDGLLAFPDASRRAAILARLSACAAEAEAEP